MRYHTGYDTYIYLDCCPNGGIGKEPCNINLVWGTELNDYYAETNDRDYTDTLGSLSQTLYQPPSSSVYMDSSLGILTSHQVQRCSTMQFSVPSFDGAVGCRAKVTAAEPSR